MNRIDAFLDWFERHKYGIVGTVVLHTLVVFSLAMLHMRSEVDEDEISELRVEMAPPMTEEEFKQLEQELEQGKTPTAFEEVKSMSSNITADKVVQRLDPATQQRISDRVENDLKAMEQAEFDRLAEERKARGEEIVMPTLDPSKWDKELYMDKAAEPVRVEGATAVWHDLKDRAEQRIHIPAYLCPGFGTVVVNVSVDRNGRVTRAEMDKARSSTSDACMAEHALSSAQSASFAPLAKAPDVQKGAIYYRFLPQ